VLSFSLFRTLAPVRRFFFFCRGGRFINLAVSRFSFTLSDGFPLFFLVPPSLLDITLLIAIYGRISWVSGEFDLYLLIPKRQDTTNWCQPLESLS